MNTTTNNEPGLPDQMDLTTAIDLLTRHNNWRRGGDGEMVDVTQLGTALDSAIAHLQQIPQLWCLHIIGPDDVYPAPTKEHAEMAANAYNAMLAERPFKHGVTCKAVVAPWPHSAASHAEGVGSFITDHLVPAWQTEAETASRGLMQLIQKASFSSAVDKQFALELASIMVPAPARPAAPGLGDTAGSDWEATDADIAAWQQRHDLTGAFGSKTDARAAFEDARSAEHAACDAEVKP